MLLLFYPLLTSLSLSSSPGSMESPGETPREPRVSFFRPSKAFLCVSGNHDCRHFKVKIGEGQVGDSPMSGVLRIYGQNKGSTMNGWGLDSALDPVVASSECTFGYLYLIYSVLLFSKNTKT